jgi:REP element-mobilizing transposase RayT
VGGEMCLNDISRISDECWQEIPEHFEHACLDAFVVMSNHIHGIVIIDLPNTVGARHAVPLRMEQFGKPVSGAISTIIRSFKSAVTKRINEMHGTPRVTVWQRNYYEHVIRNEEELNRIRQYIIDNPKQWELDRENPVNGWATGRSPLQNGEPWRV